MSAKDIRWIQRFNNFKKAFAQLTEAVELSRQRELSNLEMQGLIQSFEYTHELAWNTLKDFLEDRGTKDIYGSKDATRLAFRAGLIEDGDAWMKMIESRNKTTHTYDERTVLEIVDDVIKSYYNEMKALLATMNKLKEEEQP
ncbi:MAG: nucleotidyltransferase substrate binding protein [Nitrospirae bacterium]|nr:nucleotidyltransferase substrate binding protein [Nitrospirota bacterium]